MFLPHARGFLKSFKAGQPYNVVGNQRHQFVCPDDKVWLLLRCSCVIIDSSAMSIRVYEAESPNARLTMGIVYKSAGTGSVAWPQTSASNFIAFPPVWIYPNEAVDFYFGTAQTTGGDHVELWVYEYDLKDFRK